MRFSVEIVLNGDKPVIPSDYRRNILSLIKEAINPNQSGTEIYEKYYITEARKIKPFTFSVSFRADETQKEKRFIHLTEPLMRLHFSASDPVFLIHVYNGLVQLQKDYPLLLGLKSKIGPFYCGECTLLRCTSCKLKVSIGRFHLEPAKTFNNDEILFKTCSPIIVRDTNESGRSSRYITPDSTVFGEKLYHSVKSMCKVLLDGAPELRRDDFSAKFTNFKTVHIGHYTKKGAPRDGNRELIEATAGTIRIKAPAPVLQLIYDAGIGAKRSQGFGMVEVSK